MIATKPTRPLLRYHGGKWLLADWIIQHFPPHRIYVEPFGGAASVLLKKARSYSEVYNDKDGELVNLFRVIREHGEQLREAIKLTPFSRDEFFASYEPSSDPLEQARRTVVRSFMGFGSNGHNKKTGFRANSNRSGTTPSRDWRNYPDTFDATIERLRGVTIENRDGWEVMQAHDSPQTLHYVDPPYVAMTRDRGGDYRHEMTDEQHEQLAANLLTLQGAVIVSGYHSDLYDRLFSGWRMVEREALADGARPRTEVLWMRNVESDCPMGGRSVDCKIEVGDCLKLIPTWKPPRFIFCDPPFNIGQNYNDFIDKKADAEFWAFNQAWLSACWEQLDTGGVFAVHVPDEMVDDVILWQHADGLRREQRINWVMRRPRVVASQRHQCGAASTATQPVAGTLPGAAD